MFEGVEIILEKENQLYKNIVYTRIGRDAIYREESQAVLKEHTLDICVNGIRLETITCSLQYLEELAAGYLYTKGIVKCREDMEEISLNEEENKVTLRVKWDGSCTRNGFSGDRHMNPVRPLLWKEEQIFQLADHFAQGTPVHKKTWAMHSCFLWHEDKIVFECEDIGRHNAFDKVAGYALLHGIELPKCIIYLSGRIPADMVRKAVMAKVPVLVSKAVPTADGIEMAEEYGLTLIGAARQDMIRVYTDFSRGKEYENRRINSCRREKQKNGRNS
ncbi:MAG: formate dehydrogenase accessory sulfurtransferase FdhD [Faecalicatena sp.]|uniref:formate dehydrogenase accessory sulfurtransferase FdhD n=1 Tax=Faecalicatena sp. TaxID=2005360 RepID=UPI00258BA57F|nr:formate dehydrogenase accessory sulfurtransferase FdhD [Faecalicatena sp.]MCI6466774.1 formate dehydrogenase accessory sulfurtransferase FdhD [Faecalicatena sp.]MDY5620567.1 formate dehydrogenase accessory sulfurtransferase FdhD [Lachnospiraceae bacterium]